MSGIFISYRREDSAPYAGRLCDRLGERFGPDRVFMDVDDIAPGADFTKRVRDKLASCDAMVVVIGRSWLNARDAHGQLRLGDPNDFVTLEVSNALKRNILVIPVLVGGVTMPRANDLPVAVRPLADREAVSLRDDEFKRDCDQLIEVLTKLPALSQPIGKKTRLWGEVWQQRKRALLWKLPLVVLLVAFAAWWQLRKDAQVQTTTTSASSVAALTGDWTAEVNYHWGAKHRESFFLQPEGDRLYGTASFLGYKRGIDDGKLAGDEISFSVLFQEESSSGVRDHKNYYIGKITGDEIRFRIQDDRGSPPLEFTARKSARADQQGG